MNGVEEPLISIIIPTYNRAYIIHRAIESVLKQTYPNWELIVVDDASVDDTENVVRGYKDYRISYVRHETNQNGAVARNTGIHQAQGEYIAFLDSDDEWMEDKLEIQVQHLMHEKENVVSYHRVVCDNGSSKEVLPKRGVMPGEPFADYVFIHAGLVTTSSVMLRATLVKAVLFRPEMKRHQDWDLCIRLEQVGAALRFIDKPLAVWHCEPRTDRITKSSGYEFSLQWIKSYQDVISTLAYHAFVGRVIAPLMARSGKSAASICMRWKAYKAGVLLASEFYSFSFLFVPQYSATIRRLKVDKVIRFILGKPRL